MPDPLQQPPPWKTALQAPEYALGVSAHSWKRLTMHVGRALRQMSPRGASQLRSLVPLVAQEMRLTNASWEAIETAVRMSVTHHPDFGRYDRMNVVTGRSETETLIAWMLSYVARAREGESASAEPSGDQEERSRYG